MNFRKFRKRAGLTQTELAKVIDVTQSAVGSWERGEAYPRVSKLKELADLYGCTVDELLQEDTDEGTERL